MSIPDSVTFIGQRQWAVLAEGSKQLPGEFALQFHDMLVAVMRSAGGEA